MELVTKDLQKVCSKLNAILDDNDVALVTELLGIECSGSDLILTLTNKDYFAKTTIKVTNGKDSKAAIRAQQFFGLVSAITTDKVELSIDTNQVTLKGNGEYKFPIICDANNKPVTIPEITITNKTVNTTIKKDILKGIVSNNGKALNRGNVNDPIQKLYYIDEKGCITYNEGACVNKFTLAKPLKILLSMKSMKALSLFEDADIAFEVGEDNGKTKIHLNDSSIDVTMFTNNDTITKFPADKIRERESKTYTYSVEIKVADLLNTLNRAGKYLQSIKQDYCALTFDDKTLNITDSTKSVNESITYVAPNSNIKTPYTCEVNINDLNSIVASAKKDVLNINFGDNEAILFKDGDVSNILPEIQ